MSILKKTKFMVAAILTRQMVFDIGNRLFDSNGNFGHN